jgi:hypothetical protein
LPWKAILVECSIISNRNESANAPFQVDDTAGMSFAVVCD